MDLANEGLAFPKLIREKKQKKGLQTKTPLKAKTKLKAHSHPVPPSVWQTVLENKGSFCFMGECENCGGLSIATDPHHFPHKGPHSTPDEEKYIWPANRICHDYYHDHPIEERELFKKIESAGWKVVWKVPVKGIGKVS